MNNVSKIMFIDDDGIVNFVHKNLVIKYFPEIETMSYIKAMDAIAFFKQFKNTAQMPQVIFLDINMPEIDGWEFIDEIEKLEIDIPIYILTSSVDERDRKKAIGYKLIKGYYSKPFKIENIREIFNKDFIEEKKPK